MSFSACEDIKFSRESSRGISLVFCMININISVVCIITCVTQLVTLFPVFLKFQIPHASAAKTTFSLTWSVDS